ncbi:MAG: hypothetical protein RRY64_09255, partial [Oscillospiraceae bacterium]
EGGLYMPAAFATWIAIVSTAAFVGLWFWVVQGELVRGRNMVESAKIQVLACRKQCVRDSGSDGEAASRAVLLRSEDIYRQSIALYHRALKKPWNYIPGALMGFRPIEGSEVLF